MFPQEKHNSTSVRALSVDYRNMIDSPPYWSDPLTVTITGPSNPVQAMDLQAKAAMQSVQAMEPQTAEKESVDTQTEEADSVDTQTAENESIDTQTEEADSVDAQTAENESIDTQTEEADSVDAQTAENDSVDTQTEEADSVDAQTAENDSVDTQIASPTKLQKGFVNLTTLQPPSSEIAADRMKTR